MRKAERLFELLLLLRRGRVRTARALADELEVSERTIYRDVQALILAGVPIEGEAGVGYVLRRGFELPPLMFTHEEAYALALGARMVQAWGDTHLERAAKRVIEKVEAVASEEVLESLRDRHLLVPDFHINQRDRAKLLVCREAIRDRKTIKIYYTSATGEESIRNIRPVGLFFFGSVWMMGAWCELREDYRSFRLDRIREMEETGATFEETPDLSLRAYLRHVDEEA